MKKRIYGILMAAAILSVATAGLGKANAYFTTYATATGANVIKLGDETTVKENFVSDQKELQFTNDAKSSQAVYVRARAYASTEIEPFLTYEESGEKWKEKGGWWYYTLPVAPGETADTLFVKINKYPADETEGKEFNVIVVYETIPAADASYDTADWSQEKENGWTVKEG